MLSDELKQQIQLAYRTFLDKKGLTPRYGQRLMIAEIARGIAGVVQDNDGKRTGDQHVVVIEAGTGTGKTLAYLLGVMPVAKAMGKKVVIPDHPSNQFFKQFSNTLMYTDPADLVPLLEKALASEPEKM